MTTTRGIVMGAEDVRALLSGRKTQHRVAVEPQPIIPVVFLYRGELFCGENSLDPNPGSLPSPFGKPGDVLAAIEDHDVNDFPPQSPKSKLLTTKAIVKRVWVERVQEMSGPDCVAEGYLFEDSDKGRYERFQMEEMGSYDNAYDWHQEKWNAQNPDHPWESNCWVWCCEFEVGE